ncbi:PREDICTED: uncharacterized protein LOC108376224 [Rhagoletis zephyria]|uniref:uncharacterized protein LOC108376224 n=1 Tax=Rhagoletis zephyria TaxID=28612 RepID=UPI0008118EAF|nr:PREDICTED: uncharacterized protein LOC108376224 [Rhagoletis zephyria]
MFTFGAKKYLPLLCLLLCALCGFFTDAVAKPTIAFNLPQSFQGFPSFASFTQQYFESRNLRQMKTYSGKRLTNESLIMIYYHDSTIAVTELGPEKLLLGCELIEIYNEKDGKALLEGLSKYNRPLRITFDEMLKLMNQCERVDKLTYASRNRAKAIDVNTNNDSSANNNNNGVTNLAANIFPKSPFSLLSGIIPGK